MGASKFTCIIVDDESLARDLISNHLSRFDSIEIIAKFHDPLMAQEFLETQAVDIIFLDIEMPKLNGLDFVSSLGSEPKIIFTTAYSKFALDGYALNVIDYLLKPITFDRFEKAAIKVIKLLKLEQNKFEAHAKINEQHILISSSHEMIRINLSDIVYVEALHKYVKIVTADKTHTTLSGITAFEEKLPRQSFFRCHRSFILNLEKVEKIVGKLIFCDGFQIPVSKTKKTELLEILG